MTTPGEPEMDPVTAYRSAMAASGDERYTRYRKVTFNPETGHWAVDGDEDDPLAAVPRSTS